MITMSTSTPGVTWTTPARQHTGSAKYVLSCLEVEQCEGRTAQVVEITKSGDADQFEALFATQLSDD